MPEPVRRRPILFDRQVEEVTTTGATLARDKVSFIQSTKNTAFWYLPAIAFTGQEKEVGWNFGDTGTFVIRAFTTATVFSGSTGNIATVNTSGLGGAKFVALSTAKWGIIAGSGGLTLSGATY